MRVCRTKPKHLCQAHGCKESPKSKHRFCAKHAHRYYKEQHPIRYTYQGLKCNARRRGHKFTLTLEQFEKFCKENNYMELKGRTASSASIDRIDPSKGYEEGNLQVLSVAENSAKMHTDRDDCPF